MHSFHAHVLTVDPQRLPDNQEVMILEAVRLNAYSIISRLNTSYATAWDSDEVWRWWHLYLKLSTSSIYTRPF